MILYSMRKGSVLGLDGAEREKCGAIVAAVVYSTSNYRNRRQSHRNSDETCLRVSCVVVLVGFEVFLTALILYVLPIWLHGSSVHFHPRLPQSRQPIHRTWHIRSLVCIGAICTGIEPPGTALATRAGVHNEPASDADMDVVHDKQCVQEHERH